MQKTGVVNKETNALCLRLDGSALVVGPMTLPLHGAIYLDTSAIIYSVYSVERNEPYFTATIENLCEFIRQKGNVLQTMFGGVVRKGTLVTGRKERVL